MRSRDVVKAWDNGVPAETKNLRTDGFDLWSYEVLIGTRPNASAQIVFDYTAPAGHFESHTTSVHVGLAKRITNANVIEPPE